MNRTNSHGLSLFQKDQLMDIENTPGHTAKWFPTKSELLNNGVGSPPSEESLAYHLEKLSMMENKVVRAKLDQQFRDAVAGDGEPKSDVVNHPSHYTAYRGLEVIDLTEQMNFNCGNAVKYICRAGLKDPDKHVEDLEKAAWYIKREIARLQGLPAKNPGEMKFDPVTRIHFFPCPVCGKKLMATLDHENPKLSEWYHCYSKHGAMLYREGDEDGVWYTWDNVPPWGIPQNLKDHVER